MLGLIIFHGIDLTDIDILPQSDYVTDHYLVSCMLPITVQVVVWLERMSLETSASGSEEKNVNDLVWHGTQMSRFSTNLGSGVTIRYDFGTTGEKKKSTLLLLFIYFEQTVEQITIFFT